MKTPEDLSNEQVEQTSNNLKIVKAKADRILKVLKFVLSFLIFISVTNVVANIADIYTKSFNAWLSLSIISIGVVVILISTLIWLYADIKKTMKSFEKQQTSSQ